MNDAARKRLRAAIANSDQSAKSLSQANGWPDTYVSRIVNGNIKKPDAERLYKICTAISVDIGYILTGVSLTPSKKALISKLSITPPDILEKVAQFVQSEDFTKSD